MLPKTTGGRSTSAGGCNNRERSRRYSTIRFWLVVCNDAIFPAFAVNSLVWRAEFG